MFGLGSGSKISLTPVCIGRLCNVENYGRCYSACFSIVSLGCLSGVPIAGKILDVSGGGNFNGLVIFVGCLSCRGSARLRLVQGCWLWGGAWAEILKEWRGPDGTKFRTGGKKKWNVYISYGVVYST